MTNFELALKFTLLHEGGFSEDPVDPGGRTNFGITQRTYTAYQIQHMESNNEILDVKTISAETVRNIYELEYWLAGSCDKMDKFLSIVHFDSCVNVGVCQASKFLQRCLKVKDDGFIGAITLHDLRRVDHGNLVIKYLEMRKIFYSDLCGRNEVLKRFLDGWLNRIEDLKTFLITA